MKRALLIGFLSLICLVFSVNAQNNAGKFAIMVEKAELYSEPNVASPILGSIGKKSGIVWGTYNTDGSWVYICRNSGIQDGWVMSCVCADEAYADNPYGFDYESCYKINKEFAEGKISQERFAKMLSNLQNYRDVNYGMSSFKESYGGVFQGNWIVSPAPTNVMNIIIAILVIGGVIAFALQKFFGIRLPFFSKHHVILLLLGVVEVLFMIHPYGVSGLDQSNALILLLVQLLMIRRVITRSYRYSVARRYAMISLACMAVALIIFICSVGVVEFVTMLIETILGTILTLAIVAVIGILVYGYFTAPASSSADSNSQDELPQVCKFCKHFDRTSGVCYMDIDNPKRKNPNHDTCSRFDWY